MPISTTSRFISIGCGDGVYQYAKNIDVVFVFSSGNGTNTERVPLNVIMDYFTKVAGNFNIAPDTSFDKSDKWIAGLIEYRNDIVLMSIFIALAKILIAYSNGKTEGFFNPITSS